MSQSEERPPHSTLTKKIVPNYQTLRQITNGLRAASNRIVLTLGSYDMLHIGHVRYLMRAKAQGDYLIVGVDSDSAIQRYKGPHRPLIPQDERTEMLSYLNCVDFITLVDDVDQRGKWQYGLLKMIRPTIFVAVEDSYPESQRKVIRKYSGELVVFPRQAERTSSTDIFQRLIQNLPLLMESADRRST